MHKKVEGRWCEAVKSTRIHPFHLSLNNLIYIYTSSCKKCQHNLCLLSVIWSEPCAVCCWSNVSDHNCFAVVITIKIFKVSIFGMIHGTVELLPSECLIGIDFLSPVLCLLKNNQNVFFFYINWVRIYFFICFYFPPFLHSVLCKLMDGFRSCSLVFAISLITPLFSGA